MQTVGLPDGPASGAEAFQELERFLSDAAEAHLGLSELERGSERRSRELVRLSLQAHVDSRGDGDVGDAIVVSGPDGPVRLAYKRLHTRSILTLFGEIRVTRMGYGAPGHKALHPLDAELCLPERIYSYECQRRLIRGAICGPFDEAITLVCEMTGLIVPKRSAEQIVRDAAADFDVFYAARAQAEVKPARGEILVGAIDCKGIPMVKPERALRVVRRGKGEKANKKRMAAVGAVYTIDQFPRTADEVIDEVMREKAAKRRPRPVHKRVRAELLVGKVALFLWLADEVIRRNPAGTKPLVFLSDGERALHDRQGEYLPDDVICILDLFHVMERLWKAAWCFFDEATQKREAHEWVEEHLRMLLEGKVRYVISGLRQMMTKRDLKGTRRKTIRDVTGYFDRNRARMKYDEYLAAGHPIGSGVAEGACRHLVKDRLERAGMRWVPSGAQAMLDLRSTYLNGEWETFWAYHVEQEDDRLYGNLRQIG